jgi:Type II secretion system (T2SS), protein K
MKAPSTGLKSKAGAALLLALWALFLLSAMVISWALNINSGLEISSHSNRVLMAEAMAASGAEVALHPMILPGSPNLHGEMRDGARYEVTMMGECGRLNLNLLAPGGAENPQLVQVLRQYLSNKGVELNDLDVMIDSLLDWISPTQGLHRLNACPESDNYHPTHQPLSSVDELKNVCGWAEFTSKPHWDDDFTTIMGNCQQIDLAYASRDVLRALGLGDDFVDAFLQLRRGQDGIDGTTDDPQLDQQTAFATLGLTPARLQQTRIQNLIIFKGPNAVFRIVSMGTSGDVKRSVQMVVLKPAGGVGRPQVFSWKEL